MFGAVVVDVGFEV
jgi:hypothetical protein